MIDRGPRTKSVTIEREGRDRGGVFELMEKPAYQATELFLRAMQLVSRAGIDVPPNVMQMGAAGFAVMGIGAFVMGFGKAPWHEVKPLLDELLECIVSYTPPGGAVPITDSRVIRQQIAEPATFLQLHEEVVALHLGFSLRARLWNLAQGWMATMTGEPGPNTETSIPASESSSAPNSQPSLN